MTDNENPFDIDQQPSTEEDSYGKIKGVTTSTGADVYAGLSNAHMTFDGIRYLEALNGNVILRGRNGIRDRIFTLEKATQKYLEWMNMTYAYARQGISGWDQMMDIGKDFKARICEAVAQRKKLGLKVPADAQQLVDASKG